MLYSIVKDFLLAFSARLRSTLLFLPKFRNGLFCPVFSLAIHAVLPQKFGAKGVETLLPGKYIRNLYLCCLSFQLMISEILRQY